MRHLDLFSGIGGFAYAADQVWDNVEHTFCDNNKFCQLIIKKHWPNAKIYKDIRELTADSESRQSGKQTEQERRENSCGGNKERTELDGLKFSKAKHRNERLKALGNAIVPQVAIEIMKAIKQVQ